MFPLERWASFDLKTQMSHITAELLRAKSCEEKNDLHNRDQALLRAIDLADLTTVTTYPVGRTEIARFSEVLKGVFCHCTSYQITLSNLISYTMSFIHLN